MTPTPNPEVLQTPIWGVRLIVYVSADKVETYTLDVTKWKVFLWMNWIAARNAFNKHFHE